MNPSEELGGGLCPLPSLISLILNKEKSWEKGNRQATQMEQASHPPLVTPAVVVEATMLLAVGEGQTFHLPLAILVVVREVVAAKSKALVLLESELLSFAV